MHFCACGSRVSVHACRWLGELVYNPVFPAETARTLEREVEELLCFSSPRYV